jgi:predicted GIY-YIG superfamily endonuclease
LARWWVYVARCADDSLYCGIALDVAERIAAHNGGTGAKYTAGRGPLVVVLTRRCADKGFALRLEHAIKQLTRREKELLVADPSRLTAIVRRLRARVSRAA